MPHTDLPLDELRQYRPEPPEVPGFDDFWASTLREARRVPMRPRLVEVDAGLPLLEVSDVTFPGFGGHPVRGWYLRPRGAERLPVVVTFQGYGGGRGHAHEWTMFPSAGYAHFVMDSRGQGSGHRVGVTPDPAGSGPHAAGLVTSGIESPHGYYYRRLYTDAARAIEAAAILPGVDPARVVASGASQGGALALAASVLTADLQYAPIGAMIDVPFLQHIRRAVRITASATGYGEIVRYLSVHRGAERVAMETLDHVDGLGFAARATVPALWSVGLMDDVCPPSTVFASYNTYAGPKQIAVYPFNAHEGGSTHHQGEQLGFLADLVG
ncbi:acetylxylan esterase [Herbiconiux sp. KACC 21604]|uniref:acetylxylan esterase n=1 Tax=unclassified Herbiconiux TaxID=2618217 RepID=UPI001493194B|nr:acetylxylan esterase [Herbiconiux sp. SALV-R1]QJU55170.1 prolyl oligopeptidase family serine peptidase [Herbiconiux sp. SALV-R1]WPO86327.1 acetylxylan esterase [Herbiconiux sp. KACC 21604]